MNLDKVCQRIIALGGRFEQPSGITTCSSLLGFITSIQFKNCLYPKPVDTPWQSADNSEPINGISDFLDGIIELEQSNPVHFYEKIIDAYFPKEGINQNMCGQLFWRPKLFTPFKKGSADFDEWGDDFIMGDLAFDTLNINIADNPEFIFLGENTGYPSDYFIVLNDDENPKVYGTDYTEFFREVENLGSFDTFFENFFTQQELIDSIKLAFKNKK